MSRTLTARFFDIAVPRLRSHSQQQAAVGLSSDEVELYHRTYTTLLRSSGETLVRVLEPSHRAMNSSLHPFAASEELDLGAFIYATQRLPQEAPDAKVIVLGQEAKVFKDAGIGPIEDWTPLEAPARRRRWFDDDEGTLAVLLASSSDLDDLIPTLVAYQIEWNKLRVKPCARSTGRRTTTRIPPTARPRSAAARRTGRGCAPPGAQRWGARMHDVAERRLNLRVRMLGGSAVGYARMTRRWWRPVRATLQEHDLEDRPIYFVSSNAHSIVNLVTGHRPRARAGDRRLGRSTPTTPTSSPSSSASAPATRRARGRTSSTSPPASTSPRSPRTRTSSSGARPRSARSA